jgi:hypothetical protein
MTENPEDLDAIAERLRAERPVPAPGFRGDLRRQLVVSDRPAPIAPRRLRLLVGAYAGSGAVLMAIAAIGLAGVGPLAS